MATLVEQAEQEKARRSFVVQAKTEKQRRELLTGQEGQEALIAGISPEDIQAGVTTTGIRSVPAGPETPVSQVQEKPTLPPRQFQGGVDEFVRALGRGTLNVGSGLLSTFADVAQVSIFDVERINELADKARAASRKPKFQPATDGGVKGFIANAVGDALPFMAGTIAATIAGGPVAGFSVAYAVEGKGAYFDALEGGATIKQAEIEGMIVGSINAALELLQIERVLRFAKVGKGSLKSIAKAAKQKSIKKLLQTGKKLTKETVKLAITEGVQESLQETVSVFAPLTTGREVQKEGKARRILQAGLGGATASVFIGGGGRIGASIVSKDTAVTPSKPSPKPEDIIPIPEAEIIVVEQSKDVPITPTENQQVNRQLIEKKIAPVQVDEESNNAVNLLDKFIGTRQLEEARANSNTLNKQDAIAKVVGEKRYKVQSRKMDEAMQVYIDLQNNPAQIKYLNKLTDSQRELVTLAQNLPAEIRQIADQIIIENRRMGQQAQENNIIKQALDIYSARIWEAQPTKRAESLRRKFGTKTPRGRARTLEGILHGWSLGKKLRIKTATGAQNNAQVQVATTIVDRQTLKLARKWGLISDKEFEGWVPVEHPNFADWRHAGEVERGKTYGKNFFITENGTVLERRRLYATPKLGKSLNKILGASKLKGIKVFDIVDEFNAAIKQTILYTSFFHHQAFIRSYVGGARTGIKGLNVAQAYRDGHQAIRNFEVDLQDLVFAGLTIGRVQDVDEGAIRRFDNIWDKVAKTLGKEDVGAFRVIRNIRDKQTEFLFKRLGPYLKTQTALIEYRHELNKQKSRIESGATTKKEIATNVANLINDDFGGINLQRLGVDPTTWQVARFLMLAPDWTISNVRTMIKAFKLGDEGAMYRAFWGRVLGKLLGATIVFNVIISNLDEDDFWERYRKAWKAGGMRWLDVDITPIYRALGGSREKRKYFSILGHFRDPIKFLIHPFRSGKHKGSVLTRMSLDIASGQDWRGREFTSVSELFGGEGITKFTVGGAGVLEPGQIPSFLIYEFMSAQPIQIQNAVGFILGEVDAFDAITKSAGLMTSSVKEQLENNQNQRLRGSRTRRVR